MTQASGSRPGRPRGFGRRERDTRDFRAEIRVRGDRSERGREERNLEGVYPPKPLPAFTGSPPWALNPDGTLAPPCLEPRRVIECAFAFPRILFKEVAPKLPNGALCAEQSVNVEKQPHVKGWLCEARAPRQEAVRCTPAGLLSRASVSCGSDGAGLICLTGSKDFHEA